MIDQLTDQLRRYGDALEEHLVSMQPATVAPMPTHPRRRQLLAVAVVAIVVGVGVGVGVVAGDDDKTQPVRTHEGDLTSTTTTTVVDDTTTTDGSPSATTVVVSPTATTESPTTTGPVRESRVRGSVDWRGRDSRAELYVAACPSNDTGTACPSMRDTPVADDGTFDLTLPPTPEGTTWRVAAYVNVIHVSWRSCLFNCVWPTAPFEVVRGAVVQFDANVDQSLALSVSARVVDVFVRDRNGQPFQSPPDTHGTAGDGVLVTDTRCEPEPCPEHEGQMYMAATTPDGATRLVVNPDVRYDFRGMAMNMRSQGWVDSPYTEGDSEFWFSPNEFMLGSDLDEGHVFEVDGAPAESSSS